MPLTQRASGQMGEWTRQLRTSHESSTALLLSSRCRSSCRWCSVTADGRGSCWGLIAVGLLTELRVRLGSLKFITTVYPYHILALPGKCCACDIPLHTTCSWEDIACAPDSSINTQSDWGSLGDVVSQTGPHLQPQLDVCYSTPQCPGHHSRQ